MFAVPTLVAAREGRGVLAAAGAGGYRITTGVLHPFVNVVDFAMSVQEAIDAPRVYCQGNETFVDSRIPAPVRDRLAELGHAVVVQTEAPGSINFARVGAVRVDPGSGLLEAGAGPRWTTAAAGL
jgi:gamma-glutamyltranspeptidase/glutathione hydrolase